jgi:hypothetical protein
MNYFQLLKILDELYPNLEKKSLTPEEIVGILQETIPYSSDVYLTWCTTLGIVDYGFIVAGEYDPEKDEEGKKCIELEIQFPREPKVFEFSDKEITRQHWRNLVIDISSVLGHEYMHLNQARSRHFQECRDYMSFANDSAIRGHQEYYGIEDEIDAYAFTLAASLANDFPNLRDIETAPVYGIYAKVFGEDHKITKKLSNKAKKYLKILENQFKDLEG